MAVVKTSKKSPKKVLIFVVVGVLVVGAAAGGLLYYKVIKNKPTPPTPAPTEPTINYAPPTETDKKETDAHKEELAKQAEQEKKQSNTNSGKKAVTPVITSASQTAISAYVPGIFEEGGTCTAVITQGGKTVTKTSTGFQNATNTGCAPIELSRSDFPSAGTWSVVVKYESGTASGSSQAKTFEVK